MKEATPLAAMGRTHTTSRFALPERLARPHLGAFKKAGLRPRIETVRADLLSAPAMVLRAKDGEIWNAITLALVLLGKKVEETSFIDVRGFRDKVPLLLFSAPEPVMHEGNKAKTNDQTKFQDCVTLAAYEEVLSRFSAMLGGVRLYFHYGYTGGTDLPRSGSPDEAHFFTACGPPGEHHFIYMHSAYGIEFKRTWADTVVRTPTRGRGSVVKDDDGNEVLQVVGRNVYMFPPIISAFFASDRGTALLERMLSAGWAALRRAGSEGPGTDAPVIGSIGSAAETSDEWVRWMDEGAKANLTRVDDEIAAVQKKLMTLQQERMRLKMMCRAMDDSSSLAEISDRLPGEFLRIAKMSEVEKVTVVEKGIHVTTKQLVAEHDGRRYRLGTYVIRLSKDNQVFVWSRDPAHPHGTNHPHISKTGVECFGNATKAVAQFGGEFRYADLVTMVVRWLTKGYTPNLADTPLEEWPREDVVAAVENGGNMNDAVALVAAGRTEAALEKVLADTFPEEE